MVRLGGRGGLEAFSGELRAGHPFNETDSQAEALYMRMPRAGVEGRENVGDLTCLVACGVQIVLGPVRLPAEQRDDECRGGGGRRALP